MSKLSVGDVAPAFALPNQDDLVVTSSSLRGRSFVLYFYPADDTPGCTREACQFNDHLAAFNELGLPVFGVSPDDTASHRAFRTTYGLTFDLLSDPDKVVMTAFGAFGEKLNYGKTILGVIRSTFVIDARGLVTHAWYGVKTDGHAQRVLRAVR